MAKKITFVFVLFTLLVALVNAAKASEFGNAPFCTMDNYGNLQCHYYDFKTCRDWAKHIGQTCVRR